jgi:hypothetical protein
MTEKDKTKIRFIDHDGYRQRAACICVRNEREDEVRFSLKKRNLSFFLLLKDFINYIS